MTDSKFGFFFEKAGRGQHQGAIDPAQEHFMGSSDEEHLVRETIQNSLDVCENLREPVVLEYEVAQVLASEIPGLNGLREHIQGAVKASEGQSGHDSMTRALEVAELESLTVLRISDFNTEGLDGLESNSSSRLSRLTRGTGGSTDDGKRGGSFGIGSAVGPMASEMSTVLYRSLPVGASETVFAGYCRLATHQDASGVLRVAEGNYMKLEGSDFVYQRPAPRLDMFESRIKPGTDIFVLGFQVSEEDPELVRLRNAAIDNFLVAIHRGRLVVKGISPEGEWTLDAESLPNYADQRPESKAFYHAIANCDPIRKSVADVGDVELYVNVDRRLEKKLHTVTMREPLMKIDTFRHNVISAKYAAILVCADDNGNKLLRKLEPPQHNEWDSARFPDPGKKAIKALKNFVKEELRKLVTEKAGDSLEIEGLAKFLPIPDVGAGADSELTPETGEPTSTESSGLVGDPEDNEAPKPPAPRSTMDVEVNPPAGDDGDDEISDGPDRDGEEKEVAERRSGGDSSGKGGSTGHSKKRALLLNYRTFSPASPTAGESLIRLVLTSPEDSIQDVVLKPQGPDGKPIDLAIPVKEASVPDASGMMRTLTTVADKKQTVLKDVSFKAGVATKVTLKVPGGYKARIEIVQ